MDNFFRYLVKSLVVFVVCYLCGTWINAQFHQWTQQTAASPLVLACSQLFVIISLSYMLQHFHNFLFQYAFETYTPHVLFSTFLLSLQTTMIANFNMTLGITK
jgi:hypothetical protein